MIGVQVAPERVTPLIGSFSTESCSGTQQALLIGELAELAQHSSSVQLFSQHG
jgi:hypothetical protein